MMLLNKEGSPPREPQNQNKTENLGHTLAISAILMLQDFRLYEKKVILTTFLKNICLQGGV